MRSETIARNYAEALFDLGERSGRTPSYAGLIDAVADAIGGSSEIQTMLMSPRVPKAAKARVLAAGLAGRAPEEFVLFLQAVVKRGRQGILREIAAEYLGLLDRKLGRVRASVTLARQPDDALRAAIQRDLSQALGKEVIPNFHTDPAILGGTIVRIGDRVHDGSVRRRMARLRRALLQR